MEEPPTTIYLAHPAEEAKTALKRDLESLGHTVVGLSDRCDQTIQDCVASPPDLIVSGIHFSDGDGIDALIKISKVQPIPSIVVTTTADLERVEKAMDDHVMAYLIDPVEAVDLKASIHLVRRRFEQFEELRAQVKDLASALETRKKLERAKGIVMAHQKCTEEEAYLAIRKAATDRRVALRQIADEIIEAQEKAC